MIGISFFFGTVLFGLALGVEHVAASPAFRVDKIAWQGLAHLDEDEMTNRFKFVLGKNIFKVNIQALHQALMAEKWIKTVTVKKDYPNRLMIFVVERKPAAVEYHLDDQGDRAVRLASAPVLIDREGMILQKGGALPSGLARLLHVNAQAYEKALGLWDLLDHYPGLFIDLSNPDDLLVHITDAGNGKRLGLLHLGGESYAERWARFLAIERHLKNRGQVPWEVDLRFPGQVIVKNGLGVLKPVSGSAPESIYF